MAREMRIEATNATTVSDEDAKDFQEAYEALKPLPVTRMVTVDFDPADYAEQATDKVTAETLAAQAARKWVRAGNAWADAQEVTDDAGNPAKLIFARKGNPKEEPTRVSFRIYRQATEQEKAAREAERAAKKAGK